MEHTTHTPGDFRRKEEGFRRMMPVTPRRQIPSFSQFQEWGRGGVPGEIRNEDVLNKMLMRFIHSFLHPTLKATTLILPAPIS